MIAVCLAAALALVAFVTKAGDELSPNTWAQIVLILIGAAAAIAVLILGAAGRRSGLGSLILFAALAALTALSITWSVIPDASWLEANRTLSYLAVFGTGIACARLLPNQWRSLLGGVALFATALSAYALLVRCSRIRSRRRVARSAQRAVRLLERDGLIAALGLPACVCWAHGARARRRAGRSRRRRSRSSSRSSCSRIHGAPCSRLSPGSRSGLLSSRCASGRIRARARGLGAARSAVGHWRPIR